MKIEFAGMSAEVPDGWTDESTITFAMPPHDSLSTPMSLNKQSSTPQGNVTISWEAAPKDEDAEAYLKGRLELLSRAMPGFEQRGQGDVDGLPYVEYAMNASMALLQIMFAKKVGDRMVCVTGTALEGAYAKARDHFADVAKSLG